MLVYLWNKCVAPGKHVYDTRTKNTGDKRFHTSLRRELQSSLWFYSCFFQWTPHLHPGLQLCHSPWCVRAGTAPVGSKWRPKLFCSTHQGRYILIISENVCSTHTVQYWCSQPVGFYWHDYKIFWLGVEKKNSHRSNWWADCLAGM